MMQTATAFGLIWAGLVLASGMIVVVGLDTVADLHTADPVQAALVWQAIEAVGTAIGGGVEVVGGLWLLLVSWAALRSGGLPRALNVVGVVAGAAGILTVAPPLDAFGALFGIGQLVWFVWLSAFMLRHSHGVGLSRDAQVPALTR
jgi:hypothetical protein